MTNPLEQLLTHPDYEALLDTLCNPHSGRLAGLTLTTQLGRRQREQFRKTAHQAIQTFLSKHLFGYVQDQPQP